MKKYIFTPDLVAQLPQGLHKWLRLDVTDRAADLDQHDFRPGLLGYQSHPALDLVGDVRDHLDGAAQVIAVPFLLDDFRVDLPGGEIADAAEPDVDEALVVAQVQVRFRAVVQHVHFAVLVGAHRPGVYVDVGVEFLHGHFEAAFLEQQSQRGRGHAFADRRNDAAGKKDIFWSHNSPLGQTLSDLKVVKNL
jgi:hypothetical protein